MQKPVIYLDLDGMIADLLSRLLTFYNDEHGTAITPATAWQHKAAHADRFVGDALDDYLDRDRVFRYLDPVRGAYNAVIALQALGEVYISTAPSRNHDSASDKIRWVLDLFPVHRRNIILTKQKHLLRGDVWLDDWAGNIKKVRAHNPTAFIGAIAYPYNASVGSLLNVRAESYLDTGTAWEQLLAGVRHYLANYGFGG